MPAWWKTSRTLTASASPNRALRAAVSRVDRRALARRGQAVLTWQQEIDLYDDNGPGVIGNYLDLIEDRIQTAGLRLEYVTPAGDWEPLPDGPFLNVCLGVLSTYANEGQTPAELVAAHARMSASMGEAFGLHTTGPDAQMHHYIAHPRQLQDWQMGSGQALGSVVWTNPSSGMRRRLFFPSDQLWRSWVPKKSDPEFPTSELKRALPHIREYVDILIRGSNDARSRLLMNDILVFKEGTDVYEPEDEGDPLDGMPEVVTDWLDIAGQEMATNYWDRRPVQEQIPFPMLGETPEKVEIGRPLDPNMGQHEEAAIGRIAVSLRCPKKYLIEGPGNSKFDNEAYLTNALIDDCIAPIAGRVCSDVTRLWFRPILETVIARMANRPEGYIQCHRVRLAINADQIRPKPDKTADALTAWGLGIVSPGAVTDVLDMEPMQRPPDLEDDFAFWQATVLEKKKTTTAAPPGGSAMGTGLPPNGQPPPVEHQIPPGGVNPQGGSPEGPSTGTDRIQATLAPFPALRAAEGNVDTKERRLTAVLAALALIDQRLFASISAAATADLRRAYSEVGRRVSRAMPARSPLRTRIRDVPDSAKWAALTDAERAQVNLDIGQVTTGQFDDLRSQVQTDLRAGLAHADATLEQAGVPVERDATTVEAAGHLLEAAMVGLLIHRLRSGSDSDAIPDSIPIETMLAAGGARIDGAKVARDARGIPLSADGTAEVLGTGAATGPHSMRSVRASTNTALSWRWVHGLYRTPQDPYEPHLALNNHISAAPEPIGGQYPGDHPWCSCGFVPVIG
jgi:hypothetical protein